MIKNFPPQCANHNLNNGVYVSSYFGQSNDDSLLSIIDLLKEINNCEKIPDVLEKCIGLRNSYNKFLEIN